MINNLAIKDFEEMKNIDIKSVNKNELVDINSIKIDVTKDISSRIRDYIEQIKNPYCFKMNDVVVKVSYNDNGPSFQETFENMVLSLK